MPLFCRELENPPRFAQQGTFEFEFSQKWKQLYSMQKEREEELKRQMNEACEKLEMEMEQAFHEYQISIQKQGQL